MEYPKDKIIIHRVSGVGYGDITGLQRPQESLKVTKNLIYSTYFGDCTPITYTLKQISHWTYITEYSKDLFQVCSFICVFQIHVFRFKPFIDAWYSLKDNTILTLTFCDFPVLGDIIKPARIYMINPSLHGKLNGLEDYTTHMSPIPRTGSLRGIVERMTKLENN